MNTVVSPDGTTIALDRLGAGPPVVLVGGGSVDRTSNAPLAELLATDFTVFNIDRRGRGDSGDTPPYAVERELEDIAAVLQEAGGSANLYGSSSGAALALEAVASGLSVGKLALWEPRTSLMRPDGPPPITWNSSRSCSPRGDAAMRPRISCVRSFGPRPSSWPKPGHSRGGRGRRHWRTRSPTTRASWATTHSRRVVPSPSACQRWCWRGGRHAVDAGHRTGARQRAASRSDADVGGTGPQRRRYGARPSTEGVLRVVG
jgi:alpha-beta hydrolase superfamily lysophospholipase